MTRRGGFTLIEAMVALVIFGLISSALSLAIAAAYRSYVNGQQVEGESASVRAIFRSLQSDVAAAYLGGGPQALFEASAAGSGAADANTFLRCSTLTHGVRSASIDPASGGDPQSGSAEAPQSDMEWVRYTFNPSDHTVRRISVNVPNLMALNSAADEDGTLIATNVAIMRLRFWDNDAGDWTDTWSAGKGASDADQSDPLSSGSTPPKAVPAAVEVTVAMAGRHGPEQSYQSIITATASPPASGSTPTGVSGSGQSSAAGQPGLVGSTP